MIDALIAKIQALQAPIVVGLDPTPAQLPAHLLAQALEEAGPTPEALALAFGRFNREIIDHIHDVVPAVKPQIAMYEQLGPAGIAAYIQTIAYAKSKGLVVIGDIKRGDIASTAKAYSDGHLGRVQVADTSHDVYGSDFVTLNPYMGYDAIAPYLKDCAAYGRGVFVLVKTSNPHSFQIQDIVAQDGRCVYEHVGQWVQDWGADLMGQSGYSAVGAVVGATHPEEAARLRAQLPHCFFLVPGYGAQGGTAQDLAGTFHKGGQGAIVNSSRGITAAYTQDAYKNLGERAFGEAARAACLAMKADLAGVLA